MSFDKFTDKARKVLVLAQEEARGLHQPYVGTEHVLLALLKEEDVWQLRPWSAWGCITRPRWRPSVVSLRSMNLPMCPGI